MTYLELMEIRKKYINNVSNTFIIVIIVLTTLFCSSCTQFQKMEKQIHEMDTIEGYRDNIINLGWGMGVSTNNYRLSKFPESIRGRLVKDKEFPKVQLIRYRHSKMPQMFYYFWKGGLVREYVIQNIELKENKQINFFNLMYTKNIILFGNPKITNQDETITYIWELKHLTVKLIKYKNRNRCIRIVNHNRLWGAVLKHAQAIGGNKKDYLNKNNNQ